MKTHIKKLCDEWYNKGRADQKEEDNAFFNFEGAWELEKKKVRTNAIDEYVKLFIENALIDESKTWTEYARKVAEQLKEMNND